MALELARKALVLLEAGKNENNEVKQNQAMRVLRLAASRLPVRTKYTTVFKAVLGCEATHSEYNETFNGYMTAGFENEGDDEYVVGLIKRPSGYTLVMDMFETDQDDIKNARDLIIALGMRG